MLLPPNPYFEESITVILKGLLILAEASLFYKPFVSGMTTKSSLTFVSSGKWVVKDICI